MLKITGFSLSAHKVSFFVGSQAIPNSTLLPNHVVAKGLRHSQ